MEHVDIELTLDDIRLFTSGLDLDEDKDDEIVTRMLETTCRVYMLRCEEEVKVRFRIPRTQIYILMITHFLLTKPYHYNLILF